MTYANRWIFGFIIAGLGTGLYFLRPILPPFLIATILAYLFNPLVTRLQQFKLPRTFAVCAVFVIIIVLFTLTFLVLIPLIEKQIILLINKMPSIINWIKLHIDDWLAKLERIQLPNPISSTAANLQKAGNLAAKVMQTITASGIALVRIVANLLLVPIILFYLLRDWHTILVKIQNLIPRSVIPTVIQLSRESDAVLSAFFRGQFLVLVVLGILYSAGLAIIGLDLALLIGMLSALFSIVPYLGFILGFVMAAIAALFQFHDPWYLLYVTLVFVPINLFESSILTPWLVGDKIGLHPVAVIFAILAGGQLFGFVGILLALPITAVTMVLVRYFITKYRHSRVYTATQ